MRTLIYWVMITFGLVGVLALSACNTVHGFGEDLQSAGTAIKGSSGQKDENTTPHPTDSYPNSRAY